MSRSEQETLVTALLHLERIDEYAELDVPNQVLTDAIALRLAAMIDAIGGLPSLVRDEMFGSTWVAMRGLRNHIAHGYHVVDPDVLWLTVTEELPAVRKALENRLSLEQHG